MEGDRKYRQRGYMDTGRENSGNGGPHREERPRSQGPRPPIDVTGPRLPRMVQSVAAARCYNCSTAVAADIDWSGNCPKCGVALHCCKQCAHFEPSTRFQCLKPLLVRISPKDSANQCELFKARVTVARDAAHPGNGYGNGNGNGSMNGNRNGNGAPAHGPAANVPAPKSATDARAIFDSLFKKSD
jgi:hypothetical protein